MFESTLLYWVLIKQTGNVETGVMYLKDSVSTPNKIDDNITFFFTNNLCESNIIYKYIVILYYLSVHVNGLCHHRYNCTKIWYILYIKYISLTNSKKVPLSLFKNFSINITLDFTGL